MAELTVQDAHVHVHLSRREKVGAFAADFSIPLASVTGVERLANARSAIRGMRLPGTGFPGVIALGRWRKPGSVDFVAVYKNNPGYRIDLTGERFDRIIISTDTVRALDELT